MQKEDVVKWQPPKRMKKKEADITPRVNRWFAPLLDQSSPWEVKHTRGSATFSIGEIDKHQWHNLLACYTERGVWWKIPDAGYHNPFDVLFYKKTPSYVIIVYPTTVYAIEARILKEYAYQGILQEIDAKKLCFADISLARLPK